MKRLALLWLFIPLLASGCATEDYVQRQLNPLACRIDIIEAKTTDMERRLNLLETRVSTLETRVEALPTSIELNPADRALLTDAVTRAEAAANNAQNAAAAAEQASQRATRAFELGQKK